MADSAYVFGRTIRELPGVFYDSISPAQVPTGIAPDVSGAGDVLGGAAFDVLQSAYQSAPAFPAPTGVQVGDPGISDFYRGLSGSDSVQPAIQEPLSTPPPPTPQPATPAQGGRFEGGGQTSWMPATQSPVPWTSMTKSPEPAQTQPPAFAQTPIVGTLKTQMFGQGSTEPTQPTKPVTYSDRVTANLNQPFMEKYNSLRYGKPLDFASGLDPRIIQSTHETKLGRDQMGVSTTGGGSVQIVDRPMTLAELDPMVVHEKDWTKYLESLTKAVSTPDFDASKDPAVLQQLDQLNAAYWKFKAAKKEQALLDKRRRLLELDAQAAEYRAGLKSASDEQVAQFQKDRIEEKAGFLEKQARLLDNHDWSQGYSDEEKQAVADQARKLREQANLLRSGGDAEYEQNREQATGEHKLWWAEQASKIREGHAKLDEAAADTDMQGQVARSAADMARMQFMAVGQTREEDKRQQEAALAYQTTQRKMMEENRLVSAQERKTRQEQTVANSAAALAGLKAQKLKDQLNQYEPDGAGGFLDKTDPGRVLTPEENQKIKQMTSDFMSLSQQQVGIKENLLSRGLATTPGAIQYMPPSGKTNNAETTTVPQSGSGAISFPDFSTFMKAKR